MTRRITVELKHSCPKKFNRLNAWIELNARWSPFNWAQQKVWANWNIRIRLKLARINSFQLNSFNGCSKRCWYWGLKGVISASVWDCRYGKAFLMDWLNIFQSGVVSFEAMGDIQNSKEASWEGPWAKKTFIWRIFSIFQI